MVLYPEQQHSARDITSISADRPTTKHTILKHKINTYLDLNRTCTKRTRLLQDSYNICYYLKLYVASEVHSKYKYYFLMWLE